MADPQTPSTQVDPYVGQMAGLIQREQAGEADITKRRDAALAQPTAERKEAAQEFQRTMGGGPELAPLPTNAPQHQTQQHMWDSAQSMLLWASLAGLVTRRPLTSALNNMSAAMEGLKAGDQQRYKQEMQEYETNYKRAKDLNDEKLKQYDRILKSKEFTLEEKDREIRMVAAQYGDELARNAKTFHELIQLTEAQQRAAIRSQERQDRLMQHHEDMQLRWRIAKLQHESGGKGSAEYKLNEISRMEEEGLVTSEEAKVMRDRIVAGPRGQMLRMQILRIELAGNQVKEALKSISGLPYTATTGLFGGRVQKGSLLDASKEVMANKMTGQEAQSYQVMVSGIQRSLATLEAGGVATGLVGLTKTMDSIVFKEGDTQLTKLRKLAETRQITDSALDIIQADPQVPQEQKAKIAAIRDEVHKTVPMTHSDLNRLEMVQSKHPQATLRQIMSQVPTAAPTPASDPDADLINKYLKK